MTIPPPIPKRPARIPEIDPSIRYNIISITVRVNHYLVILPFYKLIFKLCV